jgi:hypothetical protein
MTTPPLSPQDVRAAAEVHRELGPEYSDAVIQSFFEKVDKEIQARIDSRLASAMPARRRRVRTMSPDRARGLMAGMAIGGLGAGIPLSFAGWWVSDHPFSSFGAPAYIVWAFVVIAFSVACVGVVARSRRNGD